MGEADPREEDQSRVMTARRPTDTSDGPPGGETGEAPSRPAPASAPGAPTAPGGGHHGPASGRPGARPAPDEAIAPRLPSVEPGTRPALADIEARIRAERGRISPLYQVLLHSAPIAHGWEQMLSAVRNHSTVPPRLRELAILRVAVLNRAPYEFEAHVSHALQAGLSAVQIEALRATTVDRPLFMPDEQRVLDLTEAMTRDIEVSDALFEALCEHFDEQGLVEIVATVAAYNMVSRLLVALRIGH
jgi:4-carboxymuconolactone decarboxylase